jgi:6-phosphofructokinase 1
MSAAVLLHSGGPTPVINASLLGVVEEARRHAGITALHGARHGIGGVLREDLADLFSIDAEKLDAVARAPSSALGTSRDGVREEDLERETRRTVPVLHGWQRVDGRGFPHRPARERPGL